MASFIAAPGARILSDFGADVIKAVPSPHSLSYLPTKQKKKGHAPSFGTANARTRQDICVRCDLVGWHNTCPACAAGSAIGTNRNTHFRSRECASQCSGGVANRGDGAQSRRYRQTRRRLSDTPHEVREWIARQKQIRLILLAVRRTLISPMRLRWSTARSLRSLQTIGDDCRLRRPHVPVG